MRNKLTFKIISGVVLVLAVLSISVGIAGYYEFTYAIQDQYANSAHNTARTAANFVSSAFVDASNYTIREWQLQYQTIKREWQRLADTQDATYIYLFKASGKDYENVTFLVNIANSRSRIGAYSAGYSIVQTDQRYLNAFKKIYDEGKERVEIAIYRPENEYESGNHITVMIPIYNTRNKAKAKIVGIIGVERRMEDLDSARRSYLNKVLAITSVLLLITIVNYAMHLRKNLLRPVERMTAETLRFARENTKPEEPLHSTIKLNDEIGQLAKNIDVMEEDIINYVDNLTRVTQEKEQIKAELNIATQIQADMLPKDFISREEFELYASMTPAKEVGGDFYDFFMIDSDHLALVMADVSGKGVPAALFMAISKALIKNRTQMGGTPSEILHDVNNQLCEGNEADLFVTVWLGILEISTGKVICSNAGHEYPAIYRKGAGYELFMSKHSPAVATMEGIKFRQNEFELKPGDNLFVYTDGVAEATNINEELYGTDRMIEALDKTQNTSAQEILTFMKKEVDEFTGEAPQFDDITMLCLRYFGGANNKS